MSGSAPRTAGLDAVLLDWGGTLTPFHAVDLLDAWQAAARVLAPDRADAVAAALLAAEREVWERTTTTMRSATTGEVLAMAAVAAGLPVDDAVHREAVTSYLAAWAPGSVARPEAAAVLRSLRAAGLRTGLLSNTHWPRDQHEQWLERDGLLGLLDARVYTSDLEWTKPHPDAFRAMLEQLGVAAERAVFVGDRLHDDVSGAHAVGMRTVWLRNDVTPSADVVPDAVIDSLDELPGVVARWAQPG